MKFFSTRLSETTRLFIKKLPVYSFHWLILKFAYVVGSIFLGIAWYIDNSTIPQLRDQKESFMRRYQDYKRTEAAYTQAYEEEKAFERYARNEEITRGNQDYRNEPFMVSQKFDAMYECSQAIINYRDAIYDLASDSEDDSSDQVYYYQVKKLSHIRKQKDLYLLFPFHDSLTDMMFVAQNQIDKQGYSKYLKDDLTEKSHRNRSLRFAIQGGILIFISSLLDFLRERKQKLDADYVTREWNKKVPTKEELETILNSVLNNVLGSKSVDVSAASQKDIANRIFQKIAKEKGESTE